MPDSPFKGLKYELLIAAPFLAGAVVLFQRNADVDIRASWITAGISLSVGFLIYMIRCLLHRFRYDLPLIILIVFGLLLFVDCQVLSGMPEIGTTSPLMIPLLLGIRVLALVFVISAVGGLFLNRLERRKRSGEVK